MTGRLDFPPAPDPAVTLVMVVYGGFESALRSLRAVRAATGPGYEMVVVDNASPDGAGRRLRDEVSGVRFVLSDRNLGYGPAVNLAALEARGHLLGALNSDIEPLEGWLDPLAGALRDDRHAGVAVPMYLGAGRTVQEAGRVLGCDGRGWGYGDRNRPEDPQVNFARYVDYGSAAAVLVRREAFERVGGFDPAFGLGYYEDADLSFALRRLGYLTVFEPRSKVVHPGQGSFTNRDRIRRSEQNRHLFADRHAGQLAGRPRLDRPPYDPHRELIVRDWWAPERVLLLDRDGRLGEVAAVVQRMRPQDRVTHVTPRGGAGRHRFVETVPTPADLPRWLAARRHHYSVVVSDGDTAGPTAAAVARTQPQACAATVDAGADPARSALRLLEQAGIHPGGVTYPAGP